MTRWEKELRTRKPRRSSRDQPAGVRYLQRVAYARLLQASVRYRP